MRTQQLLALFPALAGLSAAAPYRSEPLFPRQGFASPVSPLPSGTGSFPTSTAGQTSVPTSAFASSADDLRGVAAWWGQTYSGSLGDACSSDAGFSILILSFLNIFRGAGGYPGMNMQDLYETSQAQRDAGATGLLDGTPLVGQIQACQAAGKKVLLSLGGANAQSTFDNDDQAVTLANQVWNLFLGGRGSDAALRPFGDVTLDGIDLDNESHNPTGYVAFVNQLRSNMNAEPNRYIITAAPQCPREGQRDGQDESLPDNVLTLTDHVFVQHYNNGNCNNGQPGFMDSVREWSAAVSPAQLWVGAPGNSGAAGSGYIDPDTMRAEVDQVQAAGLANFRGFALWDASMAIANNNYQKVIAEALQQ